MLRLVLCFSLTSAVILLAYQASSGDFDFLEDPNVDAAGKLGALQLLSENRKTKDFNVFKVSDDEVIFLKAQFLKCDSRLLSPIYTLIESRLTLEDKTGMLSKRLEIEEQAEIRDWLIMFLLSGIHKDFLKNAAPDEDGYPGFDMLVKILDSSTPEYRNHFISQNADLICGEAILSNNLSGLYDLALKELDKSKDLTVALDLLAAISKLLPMDEKIIALLNEKFQSDDFKEFRPRISTLAGKESNRVKYPELRSKEPAELIAVMQDRDNPILMRKEALFAMTGKTKWRMFSGDDSDKDIRDTLLKLLADKEEDIRIRYLIAQRIPLEARYLKTEQELKRNEDLIYNTIDLLRRENDTNPARTIFLSLPHNFHKSDKFVKKIVEHVQDKTSSTSFRCVAISVLARRENSGIPDIMKLALDILRYDSPDEDSKNYLGLAIYFKYGEDEKKIRRMISKLPPEDQELLQTLEFPPVF